MIKKPVRNLHSDGTIPTRFCDVIVDGNEVYLEQKIDKGRYVTIPWDDVVYQVEAAKEENK